MGPRTPRKSPKPVLKSGIGQHTKIIAKKYPISFEIEDIKTGGTPYFS
jgi:hypothetical protein